MEPAPPHPREKERLAALRDLDILDTPPEEGFERITRIAQALFDVPIALVSFVDRDRQWFKSRRGLPLAQTPRDVSFCAHAILGEQVMVVPDAMADPRFDDNPLVTAEPDIRFYAGAPLFSPDGLPLGTLCVVDTKPREWSASDTASLEDLARLVVDEILVRSARGEHQALLTLTAATALGAADHDERLRDALAVGASYLGLPMGIVSRIEGDRYEVVVQTSPPGTLADGQVFDLGETYCQMTLEGNDVLGIAHMSASSRSGHPCYDAFRLEAYIGVALTVEGQLFGTLNFSGPDPHRTPTFTPGEADFVRLLGRWLEGAIARKLQADRLQEQREILSVITKAQSTFIQNTNRRQAFTDLLNNVLELTRCEYGFIGEVLHDPEGNPYLKTRSLTNIAWNEATAKLYEEQNEAGLEFRNLDTLFGRTLSTGKPVVANDPYGDPRRGGLPKDHPPMRSYLGLPLHLGDSFVGMLGLANRPGGFDESLVDVLEPLTTTIAQLIEAVRAQEVRRKDQASILRLSQVASQMTNGVVVTDLGGHIEWVNEEFCRMFGYSLTELVGSRPRDILHGPGTDAASEREILDSMSSITPFSMELRVVNRHGQHLWVDLAGTPLQGPEAEVEGFLVTVTDISERKRVERMKNEFISTISHELRTPLTSIAGSLDLVAAGVTGDLPEGAHRMISIAQTNSHRLAELINDLLDLERLIEGGVPIEAEQHQLMEILERSVADNQSYGAKYDVTFDIGERADHVWVRVDSLRLIQVMSNLLSNAAKFSDRGTAVRIDAHVSNGVVRVDVTDHGPGIPEEFRDRIFEKFSMADASDTRRRGGSGLGLAISKELIERMNGALTFESTVGVGSTFSFVLPVADDTDDAANRTEQA